MNTKEYDLIISTIQEELTKPKSDRKKLLQIVKGSQCPHLKRLIEENLKAELPKSSKKA